MRGSRSRTRDAIPSAGLTSRATTRTVEVARTPLPSFTIIVTVTSKSKSLSIVSLGRSDHEVVAEVESESDQVGPKGAVTIGVLKGVYQRHAHAPDECLDCSTVRPAAGYDTNPPHISPTSNVQRRRLCQTALIANARPHGCLSNERISCELKQPSASTSRRCGRASARASVLAAPLSPNLKEQLAPGDSST
jgi:hypothetical protein